MNGYIGFAKHERFEVYAESQLEARNKVEAAFRAKHPRAKLKAYDVHVMIAEKDGKPVIHRAVD